MWYIMPAHGAAVLAEPKTENRAQPILRASPASPEANPEG